MKIPREQFTPSPVTAWITSVAASDCSSTFAAKPAIELNWSLLSSNPFPPSSQNLSNHQHTKDHGRINHPHQSQCHRPRRPKETGGHAGVPPMVTEVARPGAGGASLHPPQAQGDTGESLEPMINSETLCDQCGDKVAENGYNTKYRLNLTETRIDDELIAVPEGFQRPLLVDFHFCSGGCLRDWAAKKFSR